MKRKFPFTIILPRAPLVPQMGKSTRSRKSEQRFSQSPVPTFSSGGVRRQHLQLFFLLFLFHSRLRLGFPFLIFLCCAQFSSAQNPLVKQWDYRFGGNDDDELFCPQQTNDGGYILG